MRGQKREAAYRQGDRKGCGVLGVASSPASMSQILLGLGAQRCHGGHNVTSKEVGRPIL